MKLISETSPPRVERPGEILGWKTMKQNPQLMRSRMPSSEKTMELPFALKWSFLLLIFLVSGITQAASETFLPDQPLPDFKPKLEQKTEKAKHVRILPAPLASYKDTYGFIGGLALMLYEPYTQTRLTTSANNGYLMPIVTSETTFKPITARATTPRRRIRHSKAV